MKLIKLTQDGEIVGYTFHCPGCKSEHSVWTEKPNSNGAKWTFNENLEAPTFSPSLMISYSGLEKRWICHSSISDGQITFLSDCSHDLAGKTVMIPDFEDYR